MENIILGLAVTAIIVAFYSISISALFMSKTILKDGWKWKDPIVIVAGVALLTSMLAAIALETYFILKMF